MSFLRKKSTNIDIDPMFLPQNLTNTLTFYNKIKKLYINGNEQFLTTNNAYIIPDNVVFDLQLFLENFIKEREHVNILYYFGHFYHDPNTSILYYIPYKKKSKNPVPGFDIDDVINVAPPSKSNQADFDYIFDPKSETNKPTPTNSITNDIFLLGGKRRRSTNNKRKSRKSKRKTKKCKK